MARALKDEMMSGMMAESPMDSFMAEDPDNIPELPQEPMQEEPQDESIQIQASEELQRALVDVVMEDYESFKQARDKKDYGQTSKGENLDFEKWIKQIRDLYNARREPKDIPWQFCSNRSLRISAAILDMLHARMYSAVVNEELLRWRAGKRLDVPKKERITKLMHWWCWVHSRLQIFFDSWIKINIGYGDSITESSWRVTKRDKGITNEEPINGPDGQPLTNPDGTPAVLKSREISRDEDSISKVYMRDQFFLQENSMDIDREPVILEDEILYRDLVQGEEDGAFINVTTLLREKIPYNKEYTRAGVSPEEAERIKDLKIRNTPIKVLKWYGFYDADGDGFSEEVRIYISPEYRVYLGGVGLTNITFSGKRPLTYTKYDSRFDRPLENDGEGVIEKVKELAEEIDAIFNQMTDAHTLAILRPGFYDPHGQLNAPALKLGPNRLIPVTDPQRSVMFPDMEIPTERLINAIRLVLEFIERLTAASSYILGKESEIVGGSGTATRTNTIVQSAEQRFALPAERLRAAASRIIYQHLDLIQLNLPPGMEQRILGEDGEPLFDENELSKEGIAGEFTAYLLPDPSMGSKQTEREISDLLYGVLMQNPIVGSDPGKIYKITADVIRARDKDPEEYLGPEPDMDAIDSPEDENTLIIQGDFSRVKAQMTENHIHHIKVHSDLLQSPSLASLPPHLAQEVIEMTQAHIQEHQLMMQTMMQIVQKFGGGKGGVQSGGPNQAGPGREGLNSQGLTGNAGPSGLEQVPGALGRTLDDQRKGQISAPSNA